MANINETHIKTVLQETGLTEIETANIMAFISAVVGQAPLSREALRFARRIIRRAERDLSNSHLPSAKKTINRLVLAYKQRRAESIFLDVGAEIGQRRRAAGAFIGTYSRLRKKDPERAAEFANDPELVKARQLLDQHRTRPRRTPKILQPTS